MRIIISILAFVLALPLAASPDEWEELEISGVVLAHIIANQHRIFVYDTGSGKYWRAEAPLDVAVEARKGDLVGIRGMHKTGHGSPWLNNIVLLNKGCDQSAIPPAVHMDVSSFASLTYDEYAKLVTLEGVVTDINRRTYSTQLTLQSLGHIIEVAVGARVEEKLPEHLVAGAKISVCGCWTYALTRSAETREPICHRFGIMTDSFQDIEILSRPPWWTPVRIWTVAGFASAIILALFAAVMMLLKAIRAERANERLLADERSRIAADLHDTIEQHLAGVKLLIAAAQRPGGLPLESVAMLERAEEMLAYAKGEVRSAVANLRNKSESKPLQQSLKEIAFGVRNSGTVRTFIKLRAIPGKLDANLVQNILMIVREAITNAIKHGKPKNIAIVSDPLNAKGFVLRILNDGEQFDRSKCLGPETGHYGLYGMEERARRCNIRIAFLSDEKWVQVQLEVPG